MKSIGVAVLGAGFIAGYHLAALAAVPEASVRLIVGRGRGKAEALARRYRIAGVDDEIGAALKRPDIDAVVIATPDDTHEEIAIRAAAAGKAILLQKPMAASSAACRRIIEAAGRFGIDLQVSFMHRFFEEVTMARDLIGKGAIGAVNSIRIRSATPGPDWGDWFFRHDRVAGGVVRQLGSHGIDLVEHVAGPIVAVSARTATLVPARRLADGRTVAVENADSAWALYELPGRAFASHEMSMIEANGTDRFRLEIYGTTGTIWARTERGRLALYAPDYLCHSGWFMPALPVSELGQRQHQAWIDGLTGRAAAQDTALSGLRSLLVAEAIDRSAINGGSREAVAAV